MAREELGAAASMSEIESSISGEGEWQELESDEEQLVIVALLDKKTFPDAKSMLEYCRTEHKFDFLAIRRDLGLDFHGSVKLCNFGTSIATRHTIGTGQMRRNRSRRHGTLQ
jgi:protein arginine N-methyltransferase 3